MFVQSLCRRIANDEATHVSGRVGSLVGETPKMRLGVWNIVDPIFVVSLLLNFCASS